VSLKKELIMDFSLLPNFQVLEKNRIYLATAMGLISGRVPSEEETEDKTNPIMAFAQICHNTTNTYRAELSLSETDKLPGDEGYIFLVDVEIKSQNLTYKMPFMTIFFDQIIGISIGNA